MATYAPKKSEFTAGSGKPKYWDRKGRFGLMGLQPGQRFTSAYKLEKSYNDSYHRAGVGIDFCNTEEKGAYSCLITGRGKYDQDADDGSGDVVRYQQSTLRIANNAMNRSIESRTPVRLFSPEFVDDPASFTPTRYIVFRGLFRVKELQPGTGVYILKRV